MEIWKSIEGYEGLYEVSDLGNVRSIKRNKLLKPDLLENGYHRVGLYKKGKAKKFRVHVLALETFVSKRPKDMQACHNDGNKINNNIRNLRWDTASNNQKDRVKHGTSNMHENHPMAKLNKYQVRDIREKRSSHSLRELANMYKVDKKNILDIVQNKIWVGV